MAGLLWYRSYLQQYYADIDGYYPGIQAGQTDAVMELSMNRAFVSKDIPPSGFTEVEPEIVGGSVAWNQLVPDTGVGDVTPVAGHIYYTVIGGLKNIKESDGTTISATAGTDNVTDLTLMLGSDVATYALGLETDQAGDGVSWLNKIGFFTDDYSYNAGCMESVNTSAHVIKDAEDNIVHTYSLDSSLTLRGLPKVSDDGVLYFDGDTYESDGTVTRKFKEFIFDGQDEIWTVAATGTNKVFRYASGAFPDGIKKASLVSYKANWATPTTIINNMENIGNTEWIFRTTDNSGANYNLLVGSPVADVGMTLDQFKAKLATTPLVIVAELATQTTESASSFTSPQEIEPDGSESYTDYACTQSSRDFEMPTGNISTYRIGD